MRSCLILAFAAAVLLISPARAADITIIAFGDSLTKGTTLGDQETYPARLQAQLKKYGHDVTVVNAGVNGEQSSGGLARVKSIVDKKPDMVILELGANDMLHGISPDDTVENMSQILDALTKAKIKVLLTGMKASLNLPADYRAQFDGMYPALADKYNVSLFPFFLQDVAMYPSMNLRDGLHPNALGTAKITENIMPYVFQTMGWYEKK
jgi:acyl-CoA thioesterase-1